MTRTGVKSLEQVWAYHQPHHGQPSFLHCMSAHSSHAGKTTSYSTADSLTTYSASGSWMTVPPIMMNYGHPLKHKCNNGMASHGTSPPYHIRAPSWISQSPLLPTKSPLQFTKNHKISTSTSHPPPHTLKAHSVALSQVASSVSIASAQTQLTRPKKHNNSTPV